MYFPVSTIVRFALFLTGLSMVPFSACYPTNCKEVTLQAPVNAKTLTMPPDTTWAQGLDIVNNLLSSLISHLFNTIVDDTFTIAGRYCEPETYVATRTNALQILIHGATYTRDYVCKAVTSHGTISNLLSAANTITNISQWTADGPPGYGFNESNSWVSYASKAGYPTLAIDRLGCGKSDHPDPILVVQIPTQAEITHQIILQVRRGSSPFPRAFKRIIVVGHSLGSVVTQLHSVNHPTDADAYILTGYSKYIAYAAPGILTIGAALPASLANPARFGNLPLGYLTLSSPEGVEFEFYFGNDDDTYYQLGLPAYDYSLTGTLTVGEGASAILAAADSSFTGSVLVITAQQDSVFCTLTGATIGACIDGSMNYLANTGTLYPRADYYWYVLPSAGHCWQYHYTAPEGFQVSHDWLKDQGF